MNQTISQKFLLWGIFLVIGIIAIVWLIKNRYDWCSNKCWECENYSPFRRTGECPPRTGYTYLDAYEQEQYYKQYPYVYPTPYSYTTAWYKGRRAEDRFRLRQKEIVEQAYAAEKK